MALISRHTLYGLATFVWGLVVFGAMIAVVSGNAEPYVSLSDLPVSTPFPLFGGAVVLWILGALVVSQLEKRDWKRAGRRAGLRPTGGSLIGKPNLEGTVRGRTVRMRTIKRKTGSSGGEGGSSKTTYTVVEVDLSAPVEEGIMIQRSDGGDFVGGMDERGLETTDVGGVGVVGASEEFARAVLTGHVRDALRKPSQMDFVVVGDASGVLMEAIPDADGRIMGAITGAMEKKIERGIYAEAGTVRTQQKSVLLNGRELNAQVEALVAVAESFETARADRTDGHRERTSPGGETRTE